MDPMKIALVSDWFLPRTGGIERHLVELARALHARGHEVDIVTATAGPAFAPELPGVAIVRLPCALLPHYSTIYRGSDAAKLRALFAARRYDIVHAHSVYSPLALAATAVARDLRIPSVLTGHSLVRDVCVPVFRALDYALRWSSWPQVITAVSEAVASDLRRASFAPEVHVLPNGLVLPERVTRGASDGVLRIVSVMRLVPRKRPLALVEAFATLGSRLGEAEAARIRLVLVGGGSMREQIESLCRRRGIGDRVELRGSCTPAEVREALTQADVFALPTRKEAFGLAALEAAAAGLPVVTMGRSGAGDLFTPGVDGLVAANDDELGGALAELCRDGAQRQRLGLQSRRLAERFTWSGILDRTLGLYRLAARRMAERSGIPAASAPVSDRHRALRILTRTA